MTFFLTRKHSRILRYVIAGICAVFVVIVLMRARGDDGYTQHERDEHFVPDIPGVVAALPKREVKGSTKRDWHNYEQMAADAKRQGPGEHGIAYRLPSDVDKRKVDEMYRHNGFNALTSDYIALNRSVRDIRHKGCHKRLYLEDLLTVAVILPFHNEHFSTLMRSVHSIIDRSPPELLKQVILADDFSDKPFLKDELDEYVRKTWPDGRVKIVRTTKREGLIRARLIGARAANTDVILFLDSHSECNYNWLPPLIEPIALDYRTVVCPFVDVIDYETFEYRAQDEGARGAFDWEFYYKRLPVTTKDDARMPEPFASPVMAGGYFAISRKWFWELGGYDEGLDIWGGEQYELSFKIWQCGGTMVDAPCSRVGHIYRKFAPFPNPGVGDFIGRNYKRVAEVWMDEYKEFLYNRRPHYRNIDAGDLTKQKAIRERLKCKPFRWFMKKIAFDLTKKYPPTEPPNGARGEVRNEEANLCIDTRYKGEKQRFELEPCIRDNPKNHGGEQNLVLTWHRDIRPEKRAMCFDVSASGDRAPVVLFNCHQQKGNQEWVYRVHSNQLFHPVSSLCMDCEPERREIFMRACDSNSKTQRWIWESVNETVLERWAANIDTGDDL